MFQKEKMKKKTPHSGSKCRNLRTKGKMQTEKSTTFQLTPTNKTSHVLTFEPITTGQNTLFKTSSFKFVIAPKTSALNDCFTSSYFIPVMFEQSENTHI